MPCYARRVPSIPPHQRYCNQPRRQSSHQKSKSHCEVETSEATAIYQAAYATERVTPYWEDDRPMVLNMIIRTAGIGGNSFHHPHHRPHLVLTVSVQQLSVFAGSCLRGAFPKDGRRCFTIKIGKLRLYTLVSPYLRRGVIPTEAIISSRCGGTAVSGQDQTITGSWDFSTICPHPVHVHPPPPCQAPVGSSAGWEVISGMHSQTNPALPTAARVPPQAQACCSCGLSWPGLTAMAAMARRL